MKSIFNYFLAIFIVGLTTHPVQADTFLYTTPDFDPANPWHVSNWYVDGLGEPRAQAIGQTFKTPNSTDTVLTEFSYWVQELDGVHVTLDAVLMEWDLIGRKPIGAQLYTSNPYTTSDNSGLAGYEKVTFNVGNIQLDRSKSYVAILSTENYENGAPSRLGIGWSGSDRYLDGEWYFYDSGIWGTAFYSDYAFEARFTAQPVPEPETYAMMLAGLALVGAMARRGKQAKV